MEYVIIYVYMYVCILCMRFKSKCEAFPVLYTGILYIPIHDLSLSAWAICFPTRLLLDIAFMHDQLRHQQGRTRGVFVHDN